MWKVDSVPSLAQEALNQQFAQVCSSYFSGMSTYTQKKIKKKRLIGLLGEIGRSLEKDAL